VTTSTLLDNVTAMDFAGLLPMAVQRSADAQTEKISYLRRTLSIVGRDSAMYRSNQTRLRNGSNRVPERGASRLSPAQAER
jgi:hypothetical protein